MDEDIFKAYIVHLIKEGEVEEALSLLSKYYRVEKPKLIVKRLKGHSKALALYSFKNKTIYIQDGEYYSDPFIVLHEFYHHLRNIGGRHRGTEDNADKFALDYINAYNKVLRMVKRRKLN